MDTKLYWIAAVSLILAAAIAWTCGKQSDEADKRAGVK
ncbi:hypothetical protein R69919_00763 [Paraburkholderia gardini]|nr:hypothetical protein R69919_00763 [Paraburkholderia gardini]